MSGPGSIRTHAGRTGAGEAAAHFECDIVVQRAGVRLLVHDPELGQEIKDHVRLDFQLAGQLIDADFAHTVTPRRHIFNVRVQSINLSYEASVGSGCSVFSIVTDSISGSGLVSGATEPSN